MPSGRSARLPDLNVEIDGVTGATRSLTNKVGYLTGPRAGSDVKATALAFVRESSSLLGLTAADVAEFEITDDVYSKASGIRHLYLRQTSAGLPVYNGQLQVHVDRDGSILSVNNQFLPHLASSINRRQPGLTAMQAVVAAAMDLGRIVGPISEGSSDGSVRQRTVLDAARLSERPIEASLMLLPVGDGEARLVWNFQTWLPGGGDIADFTVDAETGKIWTRLSWVADADYKVYGMPLESPAHATPASPADGRVTLTNPQTSASPFGWHDSDGVAGAEFTVAQGNNAQAYTDTDASDTPDAGSSPDCTASLNCVFALDLVGEPSTYRPAVVANLFYFNNVMHDVAYPFGFDEVGGNFQTNNYGNGGLGNDSVQAEAQDGSGTNNANFGTPPDGQRPRMQMYLFTAPTPDRDGDFDNGIISHEYGHGISKRLVGGPSNVSCLGNTQQAGEGLSDWWSLYYTQPDSTVSAARIRGMGTYVLNQPLNGQGIRNDYYDGDPAVNAEPFENTWTYQSISGAAVPHGVGSRWTQAYWEVTWALIDKYGYDPDIDNFVAGVADKGNIRAMYYIIEGLKNTTCNPAFTNIRDGIIQAATAAQPYNGADVCLIWRAFAGYGLGTNAVSGGSSSTTPTNGFDIPAACSFLGATPDTQKICAGNSAVFPVTLGEAFVPPVALSVTGNPGLTTSAFSTNPVLAVPGPSSLTIGNTGGVAAGSYNLTVNATSGGPAQTLPLVLQVNSAAPSTPTLSAPANAAVDVAVTPALSWTAATQGDDYIVEIATDSAFTNIVYTRTVATTSHTVQTALNGSTQYYWRVRSTNACGPGGNAASSAFTTAAFYCVNPALAIPDNNTTGVFSEMTVANGGTITDLNLTLNVTHTYIGDLIFKLKQMGTGTEVTVLTRPASCSGNDIDATFDDEAAGAITCVATVPTVAGSVRPASVLTAFDGQARNATWRLTAIDAAGQDLGTVNQWCLSGAVDAVVSSDVFANGFE